MAKCIRRDMTLASWILPTSKFLSATTEDGPSKFANQKLVELDQNLMLRLNKP